MIHFIWKFYLYVSKTHLYQVFYKLSDNLSELSCSGQINFLSRICPEATSPGIITFLSHQWTLWTNWTLFLLELEKKYFNLYIGLKFCPICPVCPIWYQKISRTKACTYVDTFSSLSTNLSNLSRRIMKFNRKSGISRSGQSFLFVQFVHVHVPMLLKSTSVNIHKP